MGIPKTGVFGLYDMIGVDLMSDVVDTLGDILPENDVFHAVGRSNNPANALINTMISEGFTGLKSGKGGFYREDQAVDLTSGALRPRITELPALAQQAANAQQDGRETLPMMTEGSGAHHQFCRNFLGRVLAYAADLIPHVTSTPQDIDDAMKMGFNWIRGPFEMIDALGAEVVIKLAQDAGCAIPQALQTSADHGPFYQVQDATLVVRNFDQTTSQLKPVQLPEGTERFSLTRRTLTPIASNRAASLWRLPGDLRLVEFHSKANALTGESMTIVRQAAEDHGMGILIHNDAQHFSAGVDLNRFADFIAREAWGEMDAFLNDFQQAVAALKYCPVPVLVRPLVSRSAGASRYFCIATVCSPMPIPYWDWWKAALELCPAVVGSKPPTNAGLRQQAMQKSPLGKAGCKSAMAKLAKARSRLQNCGIFSPAMTKP
jgi:3-hydroxyacyl-CoA dehydrogenase